MSAHILRLLASLLTLTLTIVPATAAPAPETTVLVTGANRGIGLEFARQYAARGYRVIATARRLEQADELRALQAAHPQVIVEELDVTDFAQIDALAAKYRDQPIDILINNAGVTGEPFQTQVFGRIDYAAFDRVMHVNARAPLKMTEAFIGNVERSRQKKVIAVSSSMGSIGKSFGTAYFYRSSKSALNMIMYSLSRDLKARGIVVGLVNPGPTDTDMMALFRGRAKLRPADVATADMIRNIDALTLENTGAYVQYDGSTLPW
jgi:NAD(P)-dependent dehydrogenase (short-subunit alcohol dehydrogenase family)